MGRAGAEASLTPTFLRCSLRSEDAAMKDPSRSSTSPSIISEDVIINGHAHEDDNPFAEYMWMENEEEFNRQASPFPPRVCLVTGFTAFQPRGEVLWPSKGARGRESFIDSLESCWAPGRSWLLWQ